MSRKRLLMTLRHQSKPLLVMSATCDPCEILCKDAPKLKPHGQAMRSVMKVELIKSQTSEMDCLWRRSVFQKILRSQDRVFTSCFYCKIKREGGKFDDKRKVNLAVQGQQMHRKGEDGVGDYDDTFSPVPAASGFRMILSLATRQNVFTDHVNISQAFVQEELLLEDGHNGKVHISSPPGYDEDRLYAYRLLKPLYGMPSAARSCHTTISIFLTREGCATVGFERALLASY